jgi:polyphenol oxidase
VSPKEPNGVEVIRSGALDGVPHGFLGRAGGVSQGLLAGLNAGWGSGDDREAIARNRDLAIGALLPGARLVTVHQVHSQTVHIAGEWSEEHRPQGDALVTDRPGLLLGILTADCAPILLADREAGVVGAAHAGWKGALLGVGEATVAAMERLGARRERITAAIGPCIAARSYEVGRDLLEMLTGYVPDNRRFFTDGRDGKHQFDLEGYVAMRLAAAGVGTIEPLGIDTYADPARFYSYRRATHRGEPSYGRQISLIGLAA